MKADSLREYSEDELLNLREEKAKELVDLKIKRAVEDSSEQPLKIRTVRRDLARINTVMREKSAAGASDK